VRIKIKCQSIGVATRAVSGHDFECVSEIKLRGTGVKSGAPLSAGRFVMDESATGPPRMQMTRPRIGQMQIGV